MKTLFFFAKDLCITGIFWGYYTFGFLLFFSWFYLFAFLFARDRETGFQKLNHQFCKGLFFLIHKLIPGQTWQVDDAVMNIRGAILLCNHLSYLDPIFLISLFKQQSTIVKSSIFKIPFYGKMLQYSGYILSSFEGPFSKLLIQRIESLSAFLKNGGNLFVFPEGTRSRDGRIGPLQAGAFKIAKYTNAPIKVLFLTNTDNLFKPGKILFNTQRKGVIRLELIDSMDSGSHTDKRIVSKMTRRVYDAFTEKNSLISNK